MSAQARTPPLGTSGQAHRCGWRSGPIRLLRTPLMFPGAQSGNQEHVCYPERASFHLVSKNNAQKVSVNVSRPLTK